MELERYQINDLIGLEVTDLNGDDRSDVIASREEGSDLSWFLSQCAPCPADVNGDGVLNILDFVTFQLRWQVGDPGGDCDGNGIFNIIDFVCYQDVYETGCN